MNKSNIKRWSLLFSLLFIMVAITACGIKDKKTVISKDVSKEATVAKIEIQRNIELGNKYLQEGKNDEAKKAYEKAIYMDASNNQSYLQIKDNYMGKGRIDDGFYIIKLAVKNNVDTANMNVILNDIRKKFEVTTIEKKLYRNDKFEMPKSMTIMVNNEEEQVDIKWDKAEMSTSLNGTYYCNGTVQQYERPVKLTLNVQPQPNIKSIGYIKQVYESNGKRYIKINLVEFYLGDKAREEGKKDGVEVQESYIRDKKEVKDYETSSNALLTLTSNMINPMVSEIKDEQVTFIQFKKIINDLNTQGLAPRSTLCWIYVNDGTVAKVQGQYTP